MDGWFVVGGFPSFSTVCSPPLSLYPLKAILGTDTKSFPIPVQTGADSNLTRVGDAVGTGVDVIARLGLRLIPLLDGLGLVVSPGLLLDWLLLLESVLGLRGHVLGLLVLLLVVLGSSSGGLVVLATRSSSLDRGRSSGLVVTGILPVDRGILTVLTVVLLSGGQGAGGSVVLVIGGWWGHVDVGAWTRSDQKRR